MMYRQFDTEQFVQMAGDAIVAANVDGMVVINRLYVAILYNAVKQVQTIVAIIRDETNRWNEEQALRKRINNLEKQLTDMGSGL